MAHSLLMADIDGFDAIQAATSALAIAPATVDMADWARQAGSSDSLRARAELDVPPNADEFLRREAEVALQRRTPMIQAAMGTAQAQKPAPRREWVTSVGHLACADSQRVRVLKAAVDERFGHDCDRAGDFYYPPQGYRSWHTNRFEPPGWRMYLIQVDEPDESFFRYVDPASGETITIWDRADSVNFFRLHADLDVWHCIASNQAHRFSQGFIVPDDWADRLGLGATVAHTE